LSIDGEPELPRVPVGTVPYAFAATQADEAGHAAVASALDKPLDGSQLVPASVDASAVKFTYAGSSDKGGAALSALNLQCTGCIDGSQIGAGAVAEAHLAAGSVTATKIAKGAVTAEALAEPYAGALVAGGAAKSASDLACTACVSLAELGPDVTLGFLSTSGGTLTGDLTVTGKLGVGGDATITGKLGVGGALTSKGYTAGGDVDFAGFATKGLRFDMGPTGAPACSAGTKGTTYLDPSEGAGVLAVCNGTKYIKFYAQGDLGSQNNPAASCNALKKANAVAGSGLYWVDFDGAGTSPALQVYCDMVTDGGGWTLVSYGYRPAGTPASTIYGLPNQASGAWDPANRTNIASIDASLLLKQSKEAGLTVTDAALVTGDMTKYAQPFKWPLNDPSNAVFVFNDPSGGSPCVTVTVTNLATNATFSAQTFGFKPAQVSCSGHKGGTSYERQFLGFNSATCYGVCGSDPTTSMGMVVWTGDGYDPTTSGGKSDPERPASMGFWLR
jgi:hypothetical protein